MPLWYLIAVTGALLLGGVSPAPTCQVDPQTPPRLLAYSSVQPLCAGYVDVTLPPYSAAGDGVRDDTSALQAAAEDSYLASMTLLLPADHVFLLSHQLLLLQRYCYPPCGYVRRHGMQVVGGGGGARPVVRLRDNATMAGTTSVFIMYDAMNADNATLGNQASQYQSRWRGVDIDVGNNPTVSGLAMLGAQLCSIEDTAISGRAFFAGINGLPASGGFSANVNITGGMYGIVHDCYRPNPSIAGLQLVGQARAGILVRQSRGPVVVTGFRIESPPTPDPLWRAILLNSSTGPLPLKDNSFAGEDGVFVLHPGSGDSGSGGDGGVVVESGGCDVALRNVYFSPGPGNATLFSAPSFGVAVPRGGPLPNDPQWVYLSRLAFTASGGSVWYRGDNASGAAAAVTTFLAPPGVQRLGVTPPPLDLPSSHTWPPGAVPSWVSNYNSSSSGGGGGGVLDVVVDFGATPQWVNATDDDGACIQAAIDASCLATSPHFGKPVFIPHGEFGLYRPLELHACARLIGAGSHSAWLVTLPVEPVNPEACWDDGSGGDGGGGGGGGGPLDAMLVSSSSPPSFPPLLSDFGLIARPLCPFLDLCAGPNTLLRDVCVVTTVPPPSAGVPPSIPPGQGPPPLAPLVSLSGPTLSGRFFGLSLDLIYGGNDGVHPPPGPRHVLLLVNGTAGGGLHFYQLSTEHKPLPKLTLVVGAVGVHVHAWKSESVIYGPTTGGGGDTLSLLWIQRSLNVSAFGHSGNFREFNTTLGVVDVSGDSRGIELMAMTRTYHAAEPRDGTMWVRDASVGGAVLDGHHQVALYQQVED